MGKRTSIYLADELADAAAASGVPLGELIARGLACTGHAAPPPPQARERGMVLGEPCKHPPARVHKGLCGACGSGVGPRK